MPARTAPRPTARLLAAVSLSVCSVPCAADQADVTLDTVVMTGTRSEKTLADTPVRTEIVSAEELQRMHARTLTEALENVPGLQLQPVHGKAGYQLSLQGLTSDQVLVLIDGLPIAASTGSTVDLSQYALADVERIEVVKGATSAQYGSSAMGGVINVITRRPAAGVSTVLQTQIGSHGEQNPSGDEAEAATHHVLARVAGGSDRLRGSLSAERVDDDGFSTDPEAWAQEGDAVRRTQFGGRMDWRPQARSLLWLDGNHYREDVESRYDYFAPPHLIPQRKLEEVTRLRIGAGGRHLLDNGLRAELKLLEERYDGRSDELSNGALTGRRDTAQHLHHTSLQLDLPPWRRQRITVGADYRRETLEQSVDGTSEVAGGEAVRDSIELFAQNDPSFGSRFEVLPGARIQEDSDFGFHAAPKLALRWRVVDGRAWQSTVRASFGQGYRVPNLKERHYLFDHSSLGYMVIGNPNLEPESSDSWQAGIAVSRGEGLFMDVNLFRNDVEDLIQTDLDNARIVNGIALYSYENIARARTQGVESSLRWQARSSLGLSAGYTFTDAENLSAGTPLTQRPRHIGRAGIDWRAGERLSIALRARHQSSELTDTETGAESPAWTVVDLSINHDLRRGLRLYLGVDNLFDRQRDFSSASDLGPIQGRFYYLGATFAWVRD